MRDTARRYLDRLFYVVVKVIL